VEEYGNLILFAEGVEQAIMGSVEEVDSAAAFRGTRSTSWVD
jgi:hypothetical protein